MVAVAAINKIGDDDEPVVDEEQVTQADLEEDLRPLVGTADRLLHRRLLLPNR